MPDKPESTNVLRKPESKRPTTLSEGVDIFVKDKVYPNPWKVFSHKYQPIKDVKDSCLVVLDANVLLAPYKQMTSVSLKDIEAIYTKLVAQKRLFVPAQATREFAEHRPSEIGNVINALGNMQSTMASVSHKYPLIQDLAEAERLDELTTAANQAIRELREAISRIVTKMRTWNWDDPVSEIYRKLFVEDIVSNPSFNREEIEKELAYRQLHRIPPGYKDQSKQDKGIGDYLIWKTILQLGCQHKKPLLFVTGDEKADWYHRSEGKPLFPRYELVEEYRQVSDDEGFYLLSFAETLKLFGAGEETVLQAERIQLEYGSGKTRTAYDILFHRRLGEAENSFVSAYMNIMRARRDRDLDGGRQILTQLGRDLVAIVDKYEEEREGTLWDIAVDMDHLAVSDLPAHEWWKNADLLLDNLREFLLTYRSG